ncbi:unnamed protein product [Pieris macdunnoughi]|uniref:Uncharacterized protein n=1 Tax=Pieris macdunnoughi TaxID=345717 RepID=A0A821VF54_9NEOP|nr:unnamed protein product [Pieris macdunnoughi]
MYKVKPHNVSINDHLLLLTTSLARSGDEVRAGSVQAIGIQRLDWPARSLDLNRIEHVWDVLKKTCKISATCSTRQQRVKKSHCNLQKSGNAFLGIIKNVVESMARIHAVTLTSGHTGY